MEVSSGRPAAWLRDEGDVLAGLLRDRGRDELLLVTPFQGWRVLDVVTHLAYVDRLAGLTLTAPEAYRDAHAGFAAAMHGVDPADSFRVMSAYEHSVIGEQDGVDQVAAWWSGLAALCDLVDTEPAERRVEWFGREMTAARLTAARQMEVWCYGQDAFDLFRRAHPSSDALLAVADFGVRTMRFSFVNRDLAPPALAPFVTLTAPSGQIWKWNDPDTADRIEGPANDFCLVVTQRRHVDDTDLVVTGPEAARWMAVAQCIAGPPRRAPAPGERHWQ
jgi:uncharacterized protein (TIGR03084 family)